MTDALFQAPWVVLQIIAIYLLADLIGGLFHWAEDTLGSEDTPIWGRWIVRPNMRHHSNPAYMVTIPWYLNNLSNWAVSVFVVGLFAIFGEVTWQLLLLAIIGGMNQQVHRFQHGPSVRLPWIVRQLFRFRILQDARHHWRHHTEPHTSAYCVLTPWLNPVLERIGFWPALERVLAPIFGAPRRPDIVAQPWYPARLRRA